MSELNKLANVISTMTRKQQQKMLIDAILIMADHGDANEIAQFVQQQYKDIAMQIVSDYARRRK